MDFKQKHNSDDWLPRPPHRPTEQPWPLAYFPPPPEEDGEDWIIIVELDEGNAPHPPRS